MTADPKTPCTLSDAPALDSVMLSTPSSQPYPKPLLCLYGIFHAFLLPYLYGLFCRFLILDTRTQTCTHTQGWSRATSPLWPKPPKPSLCHLHCRFTPVSLAVCICWRSSFPASLSHSEDEAKDMYKLAVGARYHRCSHGGPQSALLHSLRFTESPQNLS